MKLVTVEQMRAIEKQANENGLSYEQMMENAGKGLSEIVIRISDEYDFDTVALGLVGTGNNGGDTLIALTALAEAEWDVMAYVVGKRPADDPLIQRLVQAGGEVKFAQGDKKFATLDSWLSEVGVVMDGILGTGLKLPVKAEIGGVLARVSQFPDLPFVVAVDCPSGLDCETGACTPDLIPADITVCMGAVKSGLIKLPAHTKLGRLTVVDIGLIEEMELWHAVKQFVPESMQIRSYLPARPGDAHKGTFGSALIAAGSINYTGAALLAGKGAYAVGAGLVRLAVPAPLHSVLAGHLPEATWLIMPNEMGVISAPAAGVLLKNLEKATALLIGPGLGMEDTTADFVQRLIKGESSALGRGAMGFKSPQTGEKTNEKRLILPPLVVDADGLKLLAKMDEWWNYLPEQTVLTPHPGEMAVLTGLTVEQIQTDRSGIAAQFAKLWDCVVVLKGAFTVVANPTGDVAVMPFATPALAKAGTGDVLAGMVTGLMAQGLDGFTAATTAAWLHGQAGNLAEAEHASSYGVMASDVIRWLPGVFERLMD